MDCISITPNWLIQPSLTRASFSYITPNRIMEDILAAELIAKFLLNEITASEKNMLKEWVNASADNQAKFRELTDPNQLILKAQTYLSVKVRNKQRK